MRASGKMPIGNWTRWWNIVNCQPAAGRIYWHILEKIITRKISFNTNFEIDELQNTDELEALYNFNKDLIEQYDVDIKSARSKSESYNAIQERQNQLWTFQYKIQTKINKSKPIKPQVSYDSQSILSSSSVTKKDSKLLVDMPEDYFTTKEKKS